jgi:two-component system chemotaxis response regulator CheY
VADDSDFARKNAVKAVSSIGGKVVGEAKNGLETIEKYFELNPDILLLDITMPELDGVEVLQKIMKRDKDAKVVMISSLGTKDLVWKSLCMGARHYITKPYKTEYAGLILNAVIKMN